METSSGPKSGDEMEVKNRDEKRQLQPEGGLHGPHVVPPLQDVFSNLV